MQADPPVRSSSDVLRFEIVLRGAEAEQYRDMQREVFPNHTFQNMGELLIARVLHHYSRSAA